MVIDSVLLANIAGAVLSLAFSYIPGLKDWYDPLDANKKRGIMALALLAVTGAVFGLSCATWVDLGWNITCDVNGVFGLLKVFVGALLANQAVYMLSPRDQDVYMLLEEDED